MKYINTKRRYCYEKLQLGGWKCPKCTWDNSQDMCTNCMEFGQVTERPFIVIVTGLGYEPIRKFWDGVKNYLERKVREQYPETQFQYIFYDPSNVEDYSAEIDDSIVASHTYIKRPLHRDELDDVLKPSGNATPYPNHILLDFSHVVVRYPQGQDVNVLTLPKSVIDNGSYDQSSLEHTYTPYPGLNAIYIGFLEMEVSQWIDWYLGSTDAFWFEGGRFRTFRDRLEQRGLKYDEYNPHLWFKSVQKKITNRVNGWINLNYPAGVAGKETRACCFDQFNLLKERELRDNDIIRAFFGDSPPAVNLFINDTVESITGKIQSECLDLNQFST